VASITALAGGGNWGDAGTWDVGVPTAADDVFLDATSGNVVINSGATRVARSLNCTGYTGTLSHNAATDLFIGDATAGASSIALKFVAGMTYTPASNTTSVIRFISTSATVQSVDFAGKTTGVVQFQGVAGSWQYTGSHTTNSSSTVTLTNGTLDINGQTCSWGLFSSNTTNVRSLTLGAAAITITAANGWTINATNLTFSGASSTINFTSGGGSTLTMGTNLVYGTLNATVTSANVVFGSAFSCTNLTANGGTSKLGALNISSNITVSGTLTLNSNSDINRILLCRSGFGVGSSVTITAAAVVITNTVDFQEIVGAGAATWTEAGTGATALGDCGGNSGITFSSSVQQTWSGTSGGNWSANAWTTRVPLPQDDVVISSAFSASQTLTADMPRLGRSIDWTGATGSPTFATNSTANTIYGSNTMISGMTWTGGQNLTYAGRGSYTITSAGKSHPNSVTFAMPSGTYTLNDAYVGASGSQFALTNGTFLTGNFSVTSSLLNTSSGTTLTIGTTTWILLSTSVGIFGI
jgi:hypothetical protein